MGNYVIFQQICLFFKALNSWCFKIRCETSSEPLRTCSFNRVPKVGEHAAAYETDAFEKPILFTNKMGALAKGSKTCLTQYLLNCLRIFGQGEH